MPQTKLYLGNIPEDVIKEELEVIFSKYGNVIEFDILKDYGFMHFEKESEATAAAAALDGYNYNGTNIKVEISRTKVRQKAGMGGKGGCYRCGGEGHWSKECPRGPTRGFTERGRGRGGPMSRGGRFQVYDRPPGPPKDNYFPEPSYDQYYRSRMMAAAYDRYRYDPYERRLPPVPPSRGFDDPYVRPSPDYYRRSPPRDPYYDYYERRRYYEAIYGHSFSMNGGGASGASDVIAPPRNPVEGRVPGPY